MAGQLTELLRQLPELQTLVVADEKRTFGYLVPLFDTFTKTAEKKVLFEDFLTQEILENPSGEIPLDVWYISAFYALFRGKVASRKLLQTIMTRTDQRFISSWILILNSLFFEQNIDRAMEMIEGLLDDSHLEGMDTYKDITPYFERVGYLRVFLAKSPDLSDDALYNYGAPLVFGVEAGVPTEIHFIRALIAIMEASDQEDYAKALKIGEEAYTFAKRTENRFFLTIVDLLQAESLLKKGEMLPAYQKLQAVRKDAETLQAAPLLAWLDCLVADFEGILGKKSAYKHYERGMLEGQRMEVTRVYFHGLRGIAGQLCIRTNYFSALETFKKLQELAAQAGSYSYMANSIQQIGGIYLALGNIDQAETAFLSALEVEDEHDLPKYNTVLLLGYLLIQTGHLDRIRSFLPVLRSQGARRGIGFEVTYFQACLSFLEGKINETRRILEDQLINQESLFLHAQLRLFLLLFRIDVKSYYQGAGEVEDADEWLDHLQHVAQKIPNQNIYLLTKILLVVWRFLTSRNIESSVIDHLEQLSAFFSTNEYVYLPRLAMKYIRQFRWGTSRWTLRDLDDIIGLSIRIVYLTMI